MKVNIDFSNFSTLTKVKKVGIIIELTKINIPLILL